MNGDRKVTERPLRATRPPQWTRTEAAVLPSPIAPTDATGAEMFVIIWRYVVRPDAVDEFRAAYGADGDWARLFGRSSAFMGVELITAHPPGIHVTIDRWESEDAADAFMDVVRDEYRELDRRLERLTESEQLVVRGSSADAPTPTPTPTSGRRAGP